MSVLSVIVYLLQDSVRVAAIVALLLLARGVFWLVNMMVFAPPFDPLRKLPGPDAPALQNHFRDVMDPNISPDTHHEWVGRFGKMFRFHGFGSHDYRLMAFDFRSLTHILNSPIYEKPWQTRTLLSRLLGRGIFAMEGEEHKIRRRLIGPAFSTSALKAMTPVFFQKADELRDRWFSLIETPAAPTPAASTKSTSSSILDVSHWLSRATFDVMGLVGFDYHFHALQDESEEVYLAYRKMFNVQDKGPGMKTIFSLFFPIINTLFPDDGLRTTKESLHTIGEAGKRLVASKKEAILAEKSSAQEIDDKDILSLLIKQNLSEDPSKRLSDSDLLDQLSTFLFAGSDSTAVSLSFCLHHLSQNPEIQKRLREEIMSLSASTSSQATTTSVSEKAECIPDSGFAETFSPLPVHAPTSHPVPPSPSPSSSSFSSAAQSDAIDSLPFLDAVVRETLRISPSVHGIIRVATQDDLIPISSPVHMRDGTVLSKGDHVKIKKGSYIHIPIEGLNYSEDVWGKDALTFNPDRFFSLPQSARSHPGLANLMTFSFGPHSCIGWKFSILEIKIFIASLLPHFEFTPAEGVTVKKFNAILTRPYVKDKWDEGTQLPICVRPFNG